MKSSNAFKDTIKNYLDKRASDDELFAVTYKKENKNLDECCNYVMECAKKGGCAGYSDEEVFGWAVHYYDEDDIKKIKAVSGSVIVNRTVELTEEEKLKARENAVKIATDEMVLEVKNDLKVNVQLSEEEVESAKKIAFEKVISETQESMMKKKMTKKPAEKESEQATLF